MINRSRLVRLLRPHIGPNTLVKRALRRVDDGLAVLHHAVAERMPSLIRPSPSTLSFAITAACNNRCQGCLYGREFMAGEQIPLATALEVLQDAHDAGMERVRFYGGEPLIHPDLGRMIERAVALSFDTYVTTNGTMLSKRIDELYSAGLRWMTIGFYGVGDAYDSYVQWPGRFEQLRDGLETVRGRYGNKVEIQLNYVLHRKSASLEALAAGWKFAREFDLHMTVDPFNEPVPFFSNPNGDLHFDSSHRQVLEEIAAELVRLKNAYPDRLPQARTFLRALPDLLTPGCMPRVPCDAYQMIWVGADGTVQLCDTHFRLGNVHETPLREILFRPAHCAAARDGFKLKCPACTCRIDSRLRKHRESRRKYGV